MEGHCSSFGKLITNESVYIGQLKSFKKNGFGVLKTQNALIYQGEFKDHKTEGIGLISFPNGDHYMGDVFNNMIK